MTFDLDAHIRSLIREELAALSASPAPVRVLSIRAACEAMSWSYSWANRRWIELGGYRDLDGKLKIRSDVLARHAEKMTLHTSGKSGR